MKWEEHSRWYKFKFRLLWKYRTNLDRLHAFLTRDKRVANFEFQWEYYLWTMKQLYYAILQHAYKTHDERLKRFIKRVYISYMLEITSRRPKTDLKYYNYLSTEQLIQSANHYRYYCLSNDSELRAQDAHIWLDIMYTTALDMSE